MKLNNKGFAVSTLLYGVLTMIVLILLLILNIQRSNYNKENKTTDEIKGNMNKCISKQILLEKCYEKANVNCTEEKNAYLACLGLELEDNPNIEVKTVSLYNTLLSKKDSIGLSNDTIENRLVFKGSNPENYIKIGNKSARIISIEPNGTFKVIFNDNNNPIQFDNMRDGSPSSTANYFTNSRLYNQLQNNFNALEYNSKYVKGKFYTGAVDNSDTIQKGLERMESEHAESRYGIISLSDYIKGSSSSQCDPTSTASINDAKNNCKNDNWLNTTKQSWTTTLVGNINHYMTYSIGAEQSLVTEEHNYNLVVFLPNSIRVAESGDGTISNPYIVNFS